jgi:hypothetical protein
MLDLNIKLQKNKHYVNYASVFSRLLLLKNTLELSNCFLIVVETEKIVRSYLKTTEYLALELNYLKTIGDYVNLYLNEV